MYALTIIGVGLPLVVVVMATARNQQLADIFGS